MSALRHGKIERAIATEIADAIKPRFGHSSSVLVRSDVLVGDVYCPKDLNWDDEIAWKPTLAQRKAVTRAMRSFVRKHQQYALTGGKAAASFTSTTPPTRSASCGPSSTSSAASVTRSVGAKPKQRFATNCGPDRRRRRLRAGRPHVASVRRVRRLCLPASAFGASARRLSAVLVRARPPITSGRAHGLFAGWELRQRMVQLGLVAVRT